jgi:hypothetical protein
MTHDGTYELTQPEAAAVRVLLTESALSTCAGLNGRVDLDHRTLHLSTEDWSWSSGERVLLDVVCFLAGLRVHWPDIRVVDEHEQAVVRSAVRALVRGERRQGDNLLRAVREAW